MASPELIESPDVIDVSGPDAAAYLQGQLSQDVLALEPGGASASSLLLEPSGKLGFVLRLTRLAEDRFRLEVDGPFGAQVVARLARFKIRTDVTIELLDAPGPPVDAEVTRIEEDPEVARIEAGVPRMGAEIVDGEVIPGELGQGLIDASVSFTKGCYTGQELVARIDSRGGNVPRHLRGLVVDGGSGDVPAPGTEILVGDKVVGSVTSSAYSSALGSPIALGFVHRSVGPPAEVILRGPSREQKAEIRVLPLV
jgi:folate-binding protein YgfZ